MKMDLVTFMDRKSMTRAEKLATLKGFDQRNEDDYVICPYCPCGQAIIIPKKETDPVYEVKMKTFPNCSKCNTDNAVVIIEHEF